ncbi:MAG: GNAT family N-acetyltransferase [Bacteroidetes bacterium]|nr:GNAT family N-acetyltransferase [Bacteroidota bacterium]
MFIREALIGDIYNIQIVRNSVIENALSDPSLVTDEDCKEFLTVRGKGWVCEINTVIVGFSIIDLKYHNVWALFVLPEFEHKGIGKQLHDTMLEWYFSQSEIDVWLSTAPNTRAESFYRKAGWLDSGFTSNGEIKFVMSYKQWAS